MKATLIAQWNIESIATFEEDSLDGNEVLDLDVHQWIDNDAPSIVSQSGFLFT